ncbi:linear amide C-N hydrolase [Salinivirga cyanobacteriivorans]
MKRISIFLILILAILTAKPCTTFTFQTSDGKVYFGRNYDFPTGEGHICINQRGLIKHAFTQPPEKPFNWKAKYGSISFNQAGREFPYGGMNEQGLVIEQMWLRETQYPEMDDRLGLTELQWIQYQLDMSATVQEVINSDSLLRISSQSVATLHFLVTDAGGNKAVIEYLNGAMRVYTGDELPHAALANCPYERSMNYLLEKGADNEKSFSDWTENSSGRFATATRMISKTLDRDPVSHAFSVLDSVAQGNQTQWSIVYDISNRIIYLKTFENQNIRRLIFADFAFDFNPENLLYANIHQGNFSLDFFMPFSVECNLELINTVFSKVEFLRQNVPETARKASAVYPMNVIQNTLKHN